MMESTNESEPTFKSLSEFEKCLKIRSLVRMDPSDELLTKEISNAEYDLKRAEESLAKDDYKWTSIQAYYSMYHSGRVMLLSKGYREKSHYCLLVALRELFVTTGELDKFVVDNFEICMAVKHEADDGSVPDPGCAKMCLESAMNFLIFAIQVAQH